MAEPEPADVYHLRAATGWMELGNPKEAALELDKLSPAGQRQAEVLDLRWDICSKAKDWSSAVGVAESMVKEHPDKPSGWTNLAYALRRSENGGLNKAWEILIAAAARFPKQSIIPYNLSCYAAQLGRLDEAWDWFRVAIRSSPKSQQIKEMALKDPDLLPIRERLLGL